MAIEVGSKVAVSDIPNAEVITTFSYKNYNGRSYYNSGVSRYNRLNFINRDINFKALYITSNAAGSSSYWDTYAGRNTSAY